MSTLPSSYDKQPEYFNDAMSCEYFLCQKTSSQTSVCLFKTRNLGRIVCKNIVKRTNFQCLTIELFNQHQVLASRFFLIQADVEINGQWYRGDNDFTSKRNAEQAAAKTAYNSLSNDDMELQSGNIHIGQHMPERYAHIEQCISDMVMAHGGRIRKIHPPNSNGIYKIEITGKYRYCENVQRHHRINRVYLLVDPVNNIYYQKCYDPDCHNFRSAAQSLPIR
ncbi:unnamed protein product [Adineta ricciae]|uniref:DNA-directed primase/polymerase protein n=1 Tax=Adineta ricciae TaxID=249248 RepID=A0A814LZS1_ADIRI|nr:unnamed protein product [Adineta ricciae]